MDPTVPNYARSTQSSAKKTSRPNGHRQPPAKSALRLRSVGNIPRESETTVCTAGNARLKESAAQSRSREDAMIETGKMSYPRKSTRHMIRGAPESRGSRKNVTSKDVQTFNGKGVSSVARMASPSLGDDSGHGVEKRVTVRAHPERRDSRNWQATSIEKTRPIGKIPRKPVPEGIRHSSRIREPKGKTENVALTTDIMFPVTPFIVDTVSSQEAVRVLHKTATRSTKDSTSVTAQSMPGSTDFGKSNKQTRLRHLTSRLRKKSSRLEKATNNAITTDEAPPALPSIKRNSKFDALYKISQSRSSHSSKSSSLDSTPPKIPRVPTAKANKVLGKQETLDFSDDSPPSDLGSIARVVPWDAQRDDGTFVTKGEMVLALRRRPSGLPKARSASPSPVPEHATESAIMLRSPSGLSVVDARFEVTNTPAGAPPVPKRSPARLLIKPGSPGASLPEVDPGATPCTPQSRCRMPRGPEEEHWDQAVTYIRDLMTKMKKVDEEQLLEAQRTSKEAQATAQERLRVRGLMAIENGHQLGLAPDIPFQDMDDEALENFALRLEEEIIDSAADEKTIGLKSLFFPMKFGTEKYTLQQLQFFGRKLRICENEIRNRSNKQFDAQQLQKLQKEAAAAHSDNEKRYSMALAEIDESRSSVKKPFDLKETTGLAKAALTLTKYKRQAPISRPMNWVAGTCKRTPAADLGLEASLTPFVITGGGRGVTEGNLTVKPSGEQRQIMSCLLGRDSNQETEYGDTDHKREVAFMTTSKPVTPGKSCEGLGLGLGISNLGEAVAPGVSRLARHKPQQLSISSGELSLISIRARHENDQAEDEEELNSPLTEEPLVVPASPNVEQPLDSPAFKPDRGPAFKQALARAATDRARKLSGKSSHPAMRGKHAFDEPIPPTPPLRITPPGPKSAPLPSKTFIRKPWDSKHKGSMRVGPIAQGDSDESMIDFDTPSRVYPVQKVVTSLSTQNLNSIQADASSDGSSNEGNTDQEYNPFRDRRRQERLAWQRSNVDGSISSATDSHDGGLHDAINRDRTTEISDSQQVSVTVTARPSPRKTSRVEIEIENFISALQQHSPGKAHTSNGMNEIHDRTMINIRLELNLRPLKLRSETDDPRNHPHHRWSWNTEKLMCAQVHNPANLLPPPPPQPANETLDLRAIPSTYFEPKRPVAKPKLKLQRCDNCSQLCCLYAEKLLASSIAARREDEMCVKKRAEEAADKLRVMFPNGVEDFSTFMTCSECKASVCPQCADVCIEALCGQVVCKEHLDAQGCCSLHESVALC